MPRRKSTIAQPPPAPSATLIKLGAQVRRLRLERDLTLEELAGRAGMSYNHVERVELAKAEACVGALIRLARGLDVTVGELFETITPSNTAAYRLSPPDVADISAALSTVKTIVDRALAREPRPVHARASRRPRR